MLLDAPPLLLLLLLLLTLSLFALTTTHWMEEEEEQQGHFNARIWPVREGATLQSWKRFVCLLVGIAVDVAGAVVVQSVIDRLLLSKIVL